MEYFWGALMLGFLSSFHCIGMCGPIAIALPFPNTNQYSVFLDRILYNIGRIITYILLGIIFSIIGVGFTLFGLQQVFAIAIGSILIILIICHNKFQVFVNKYLSKNFLYAKLKLYLNKLLHKKTHFSFLLIGILNGFLPCGFVYFGIAGAMLTQDVIYGAIYMGIFGIGTIPMMLGISYLRKFLNFKIQQKVYRFVPFLMLLISLMLLLRGLNLGIPYLSPKIPSEVRTNENIICH